MDANSTLLGISLVERILLEDIDGIKALCGVLSPRETGELVQFLSTVTASMLLEQRGLTGAVETVSGWRDAALAGAADA